MATATAASAPTAPNRNMSIEFIVKPKEDLYLEGSLRRLPRVTKGEAYPCQMQKTQTFSCLFRHYAKHNGLRKEDLIFTFVDELLSDQTPETVHLMPQDEIWVEHRYPAEVESKSEPESRLYSEQFRSLLDNGALSDVTFLVDGESIAAHRAILSARSEYFHAMFRVGGMSESRSGSEASPIHIPSADRASFRRMLEFLYTNTVRDLPDCSAVETIALLSLATEYLMKDLKELCEKTAARSITVPTLGRLLLLSNSDSTSAADDAVLRTACVQFVNENRSTLLQDASFRAEVESCAELGWLLFEVPVQCSNVSSNYWATGRSRSDKRRRITAESSSSEIDMADFLIASTEPNTISQTSAIFHDY